MVCNILNLAHWFFPCTVSAAFATVLIFEENNNCQVLIRVCIFVSIRNLYYFCRLIQPVVTAKALFTMSILKLKTFVNHPCRLNTCIGGKRHNILYMGERVGLVSPKYRYSHVTLTLDWSSRVDNWLTDSYTPQRQTGEDKHLAPFGLGCCLWALRDHKTQTNSDKQTEDMVEDLTRLQPRKKLFLKKKMAFIFPLRFRALR